MWFDRQPTVSLFNGRHLCSFNITVTITRLRKTFEYIYELITIGLLECKRFLHCSESDIAWILPVAPVAPYNPVSPVLPMLPGCPGGPTTPGRPGTPSFPWSPTGPGSPGKPIGPPRPVDPTGPGIPGCPGTPGNPVAPGTMHNARTSYSFVIKPYGFDLFASHATKQNR